VYVQLKRSIEPIRTASLTGRKKAKAFSPGDRARTTRASRDERERDGKRIQTEIKRIGSSALAMHAVPSFDSGLCFRLRSDSELKGETIAVK
jgi:hypothetical protein